MALSGSFQTRPYTSTSFPSFIIVEWSVTQDVFTNQSTMLWKVKGGSTGTDTTQYTMSAPIRVYINGERVLNITDRFRMTKNQVIGSGTIVIDHDPKGEKSVNVSAEAAIYSSSVNSTYSGVITLDPIKRGSNIESASDVVLGNECNISWLPTSELFYYKLKFTLGQWSYITEAIYPNSIEEFIYTDYVIPLEIANQLINATSGIMTVMLYTYSDNSCSIQIGSTSIKTFVVTIPENIIPVIDFLSVEMDNSENDVISSWGVAVAGYTKVKINATANGVYNSKIDSFSLKGGYSAIINGSELSYIGDKVTLSGDIAFEVNAKDSRGRESETVVSNPISFHPHSEPKILSFSVERNRDNQTNIDVRVNWTYSSVNGKNSSFATLYYKKRNVGNWIECKTIGEEERDIDIILTNFEEESSYDFKIIVEDALSTKDEKDTPISTIGVLLDFKAGGKGLGIGKIAEIDAMEVALDAHFLNDIYIKGVSLEDYIKSLINSV